MAIWRIDIDSKNWPPVAACWAFSNRWPRTPKLHRPLLNAIEKPPSLAPLAGPDDCRSSRRLSGARQPPSSFNAPAATRQDSPRRHFLMPVRPRPLRNRSVMSLSGDPSRYRSAQRGQSMSQNDHNRLLRIVSDQAFRRSRSVFRPSPICGRHRLAPAATIQSP